MTHFAILAQMAIYFLSVTQPNNTRGNPLPFYEKSDINIIVHNGRICYFTKDYELIIYDCMGKKYAKTQPLTISTQNIVVPIGEKRLLYLDDKYKLHIYDCENSTDRFIDTPFRRVTNAIVVDSIVYFYDCFSDCMYSYDTLIGLWSSDTLELNKGIISINYVDDVIFLAGRMIVFYDIMNGWTKVCDDFAKERIQAYSNFDNIKSQKSVLVRWCSFISNKRVLAITNTNEFHIVINGAKTQKYDVPNIIANSSPIKRGNLIYYINDKYKLCIIDSNKNIYTLKPINEICPIEFAKCIICSDSKNSRFLVISNNGRLITVNLACQ